MFEIWPSLISADLLDLKGVMEQLDSLCHGYHIDIMDNHFVPNLTWGAQFANALATHTKKPLWLHLMIDAPEKFLARLDAVPAGAYITFHVETTSDINSLIKAIREKKWRPSIALNPGTPVEQIFPYLEHVDQAVIMTVNPGFSGQQLIPQALEKILPLTHILRAKKLKLPIAVDGGITRDTITMIHDMGVSQFAIAAGIFAHANPKQELEQLYMLGKK